MLIIRQKPSTVYHLLKFSTFTEETAYQWDRPFAARARQQYTIDGTRAGMESVSLVDPPSVLLDKLRRLLRRGVPDLMNT